MKVYQKRYRMDGESEIFEFSILEARIENGELCIWVGDEK